MNSLNKILPLVLVLSLSLILGNQAAFAQTTDVWAFYCEDGTQFPAAPASDLTNMGALVDAFQGAPGSSDSTTCALKGDANYPSNIIRLPWGDTGTPIVYKSISEKNTIDNDPDIMVQCFAGAPDPDGFGQFEWNFMTGTDTVPWDCIDNLRAVEDLGVGIAVPALYNKTL